MTDPMQVTAASQGASREQVRVVLIGHIDHGKSTLVGRLLHETSSLPEGKLEALQAASARRGMPFEWSFLLDALQTERDQGVTIDTSQILLKTATRDIMLIDAPGHVEFLRNMITGASQSDGAMLIIDAIEGVRDQTRRHAYLLKLLDIKQVAVVINKMDRVDFDAGRFEILSSEISTHLMSLGITPAAIIPISARDGDGVAARTPVLDWYNGPTIVEMLDTLAPLPTLHDLPLRLPVQAIYKFDDRRIIAGRLESGSLRAGDEIVVAPAGKIARVKSIESWPATPLREPQYAGSSVGITLDRELFIERGDVIAHAEHPPHSIKQLRARIFWLHETALITGSSVTLRVGTREARATVIAVTNAMDPGEPTSASNTLERNSVGDIDFSLKQPLSIDTHAENPRTGRLAVEVGDRLAGGGLVLSVDAEQDRALVDIVPVHSSLRTEERTARYGHRGAVIWLTGLPGAGKSTLAQALERRLFDIGGAPILLDGDTLRNNLNSDLGFTEADRSENVRRLGQIASHLANNGYIAIVAAVSPFRDDRDKARASGSEAFYEVHISTSQEICEARDPKGHYAKARAGRLNSFTGIGNDYQPPAAPELIIDCGRISVEQATEQLLVTLQAKGTLRAR